MKRHAFETMTKLAALVAIAAADAYAEERGSGDSGMAHQRIVVSIPDRKLIFFEDGRMVKVYDVAVGKTSTPTPEGEFRVINHLANPTYYHGAVVIAPGKDNPLGTRWMGLSAAGYGIHGTNVPESIGFAASHGCIRMRQHDLEELFELVHVGAMVELRGERPNELAQVFAASMN